MAASTRSAGRGLDHLVLAVKDLEAAAAAYARLGFTVTPRAQHPWGTANHLVQLGGSFLEILGIDRPERIRPAEPGGFSFGAFNRDFLARREGFSMLVLDSRDADADIADFARRGLPTFPRFDFERVARRPDGSERKVAFSLAFTRIGAGEEAGFFTCAQHYPENFWTPDFQRHANTAADIAAVTLVAPDPMALQSRLAAFAGSDRVRVTGHGIAVETARGSIEAVTPHGARLLYGVNSDPAGGEEPRFAGFRIAVADPSAAERAVSLGGLPAEPIGGRLVVPSGTLFGTALAFEAR